MENIESSPTQTPENSHSRFGGFHARTYEMELLVSGAVVVGLIQLPGVVARWAESFRAGLDGTLRIVGLLAPAYLQIALVTLIATFILHLAMRGFWIGLLGLESVFPAGIRWEQLKLGPRTVDRYRRGVGSLGHTIDRVDDLCSLLFSFGFLVVFSVLYSVVFLVGVGLLSYGISSIAFGGEKIVPIFWIVLVLLIALMQAAQSLDKVIGRKASGGGFGERVLVLLVNFAYLISPTRLTGAIQFTLGTNLSNAKVAGALVVWLVLIAVFQAGGGLIGGDVFRFDSLEYFPRDLRAQGVDPIHYRSLRDPDLVTPLVPTIESDVVTGPYLKLFLPYYPLRHNPLIEKSCPDLSPDGNGLAGSSSRDIDDAVVLRAASCIGSLYAVSIDGEFRTDLHFDFFLERRSGLEGVVAMVPSRGLAPGRHEIEVLAPGRTRDGEAAEAVRHLIPFWI